MTRRPGSTPRRWRTSAGPTDENRRPGRSTPARTQRKDGEMASVKLGVHLPVAGPGASPEIIAQVGEEAERIGLDSVWSWERLMRPTVPIAMGGMTTVLSRAGGVDVSERLGCPF